MGKKFSLADLPETIPVFPLPGALLLPRARLPLNIFEPRYLAMLEDTLKTPHRLIGMIQPVVVPEGAGRAGAAAPDRLRRAGDRVPGDRGRALPDHALGRQPLPARRAAGRLRALSQGAGRLVELRARPRAGRERRGFDRAGLPRGAGAVLRERAALARTGTA